MNTHLRHLIQELRTEGWDYLATQTNGAPHFVHPQFGKVVIASTPADWEDECNYTRQRIRKATRRHQELPVQVAPEKPLQGAFEKIDRLQRELLLLQEEAPRLFSAIKDAMQPFYARMLEERRLMVEALGNSLCDARWKPKQRNALEELCLIIVDSTLERLQVDFAPEFPFIEVLRKGQASVSEEEEDFDEEPMDKFDIDAWERWFDEQESNTTYHPEKEKSARSKPNMPQAKAADAQALGRKLYLGLARELHPDKTTVEEDRIHRTNLMKQLNAAYSKGDVRTLLSILHIHGSETQRGSLGSDTQAILLQALAEQEKELRAQIRQAKSELPDIEGDWLAILSSEKQKDSFIRKERRIAESECKRLHDIRMEIQSPRGLSQLLKETDALDWIQVF